MKKVLTLTLALTLAAILALGGCTIETRTYTEGERLYPRDRETSFTCSIDEWERVKRRITVCEQQGWGSKPFEGCPSEAIRSECTYKGDLHDNSLNNQETPTTSPN